jgi:hypothetical protein
LPLFVSSPGDAASSPIDNNPEPMGESFAESLKPFIEAMERASTEDDLILLADKLYQHIKKSNERVGVSSVRVFILSELLQRKVLILHQKLLIEIILDTFVWRLSRSEGRYNFTLSSRPIYFEFMWALSAVVKQLLRLAKSRLLKRIIKDTPSLSQYEEMIIKKLDEFAAGGSLEPEIVSRIRGIINDVPWDDILPHMDMLSQRINVQMVIVDTELGNGEVSEKGYFGYGRYIDRFIDLHILKESLGIQLSALAPLSSRVGKSLFTLGELELAASGDKKSSSPIEEESNQKKSINNPGFTLGEKVKDVRRPSLLDGTVVEVNNEQGTIKVVFDKRQVDYGTITQLIDCQIFITYPAESISKGNLVRSQIR